MDTEQELDIQVGDTWATRDGGVVRITGLDPEDPDNPILGYRAGRQFLVRYTVEGKYDLALKEHGYDLVEKLLPAGGLQVGTFNQYSAHALKTWTGDMPGTGIGLFHLALKFAGEAGEFAEHLGKALRDDGATQFCLDTTNAAQHPLSFTPERREHMLKEIGDVLWYAAVLADELGSSLEQVALMNAGKTASRAARGTIKGSGDDR